MLSLSPQQGVCDPIAPLARTRYRSPSAVPSHARGAMKIAVIHDYADVFRGTRAYPKLKDHEVRICTDAYTEPERVIVAPHL